MGVVVGWFSNRHSGNQHPSPAQAPVTLDHGARSESVHLSELLKQQQDRNARHPSGSLAPLLTDWTDEEVATAFKESIKSPAGLFASEVENSLAVKLFDEWLIRDFGAALAWFETMGSHSLKQRMVRSLSQAWPKEKSEEGLAFAVANPKLFPSSSVWSLFGKILDKRAAQGPQAVEDFFRELRGAGIEPRFDLAVSIPDGFDFSALSEGPEFAKLYQSGNAAAIMRAWSDRNGDEAFDWLLQSQGPAALKNLANSAEQQSEESLQWLGGKMSALDPAQRKEFYDSMLGRWVQIPHDMQTFTAGMKDPQLQDEMRELSIQSIYAGNIRGVFPFLEAVEDPARRIEMLEEAEPARLFTEKPYFRGYDKSTETLLANKLTEWKATPEQIQMILERFKK